MVDHHYENPRLAALYDLDSGWSADRDFYMSLAGDISQSILDLGCGTGLLARTYAARGHRVTAVDPAAAMLFAGRTRAHGDQVEWVQDSAETYRSSASFDLIIMTGHAFQALLLDNAINGAIETMRRHLAPGGHVVFESRNPAIDWPSRWDYDIALDADGEAVTEQRRWQTWDGERLSFELRYQFPDATHVSTSVLRFLSRGSIEQRVAEAGLVIDHVLGDWSGGPFDPATSEEMIFGARTR